MFIQVRLAIDQNNSIFECTKVWGGAGVEKLPNFRQTAQEFIKISEPLVISAKWTGGPPSRKTSHPNGYIWNFFSILGKFSDYFSFFDILYNWKYLQLGENFSKIREEFPSALEISGKLGLQVWHFLKPWTGGPRVLRVENPGF